MGSERPWRRPRHAGRLWHHSTAFHSAVGAAGHNDHWRYAALEAVGFTVVQPTPGDLSGTSPDNFVNKDADGRGVQLELTTDLRTDLFPTKGGPASTCTATFTTCGQAFVDAVRSVYTAPTTDR